MSQKITQKRKCAPKLKKAPQAPRRFKSAYMFFSTETHKHIREALMADGKCEKTTEIAKLVSQAWKKLSDVDRNHWEEKARQDKARFEVEKSMYSGPWKVPSKKQPQVDPNIPKRPMSAFLAFSNANRAEVKRKNPEFTNAQLSRHLAQQWKEATEEEKKEYVDHEYTMRQKYLADIAAWRKVHEKVITEQRNKRENFAMRQVINGGKHVYPSLLARRPQPSTAFNSSEKKVKYRSMSTEPGGSRNPYSAVHYNHPIPTRAGYPPQPDERYAAYPHPDGRHVAYRQLHCNDSSTYPAQIAPLLVNSQPGDYSQYYPSRNEDSDVDGAMKPHVYGNHSDPFLQNRNSTVSSRYQEPTIPFPSPINAGKYASHNKYPAIYSEELHSSTIQIEIPQQVSSGHYHTSFECPYEYTPSSKSERRFPEDSNAVSYSQFSPKRRIHDNDHGS